MPGARGAQQPKSGRCRSGRCRATGSALRRVRAGQASVAGASAVGQSAAAQYAAVAPPGRALRVPGRILCVVPDTYKGVRGAVSFGRVRAAASAADYLVVVILPAARQGAPGRTAQVVREGSSLISPTSLGFARGRGGLKAGPDRPLSWCPALGLTVSLPVARQRGAEIWLVPGPSLILPTDRGDLTADPR